MLTLKAITVRTVYLHTVQYLTSDNSTQLSSSLLKTGSRKAKKY